MSIYFDYNATTPLDERVLEAMMPFLSGKPLNTASLHDFGRVAANGVEQAREQVASLVNAHPSQVIFTSGGTEANNLALKGYAASDPKMPIAITSIEHRSVLAPAESLAALGHRVDIIPVNSEGEIDGDSIAPDVKLISVILANNETGVIQNFSELVKKAKSQGAVVHTDAVQAVGKIEVDFNELGVDMLTLSAHKIYGPQGVGCLIMNRSLLLHPQNEGGSHESGLRSGTLNVAAIIGFGKAAEIAKQELKTHSSHMKELHDQLEAGLEKIPNTHILSKGTNRLPNTTFFAMPGMDGEMLLMNLDKAGFAVSSGSACSSMKVGPSHVAEAMNVPESLAECLVRVSLGRQNTQSEVQSLLEELSRQAIQ